MRHQEPHLTPKQISRDDLLEELLFGHQNLLLIGRGGSGKTYLINQLTSDPRAEGRNILVVAPTGLATGNYKDARTIHSVFSFRPGVISKEELEKPSKYSEVMARWDTIVIDELSLVRADILDGIDTRLRKIKKVDEPFGGVRIILVGDPYQIQPVVGDDDEALSLMYRHSSPNAPSGFYFFNSRVYRDIRFQNDLKIFCLESNFRQSADSEYAEILDAMRVGTITDSQIARLNTRHDPHCGNVATTLTTMGKIAEQINHIVRAQFPRPEYVLSRHVTPSGIDKHPAVRYHPVMKTQRLRVGERVMTIVNNQEDGFFNGSQGVVKGFRLVSDDISVIEVELENGSLAQISRATFDITVPRIDGEAIRNQRLATIVAFPLISAAALTIHKAQGLTLDRATVNVGYNVFAFGQLYVALSRVRRLSDLYLVMPVQRAHILVSPEVEEFMDRVRPSTTLVW